MAISLTCACGARLEIDDKFAGKLIPCPDCSRSLQVAARPPAHQRTSALALASLAVALAGAFTFVGSIAGIALGYVARKEILREPERVTGLRFAEAGMAAGVAGLFLTLAALFAGDVVGIDSLLREFRWASKVEYDKVQPDGRIKRDNQHNALSILPPSARWGLVRLDKIDARTDKLIITDLVDDAHITCLPMDAADDLAAAKEKAVQRFLESDLVRALGRPGERAASGGEPKATPVKDTNDVLVDVRLGGFERTFLIRVFKQNGGETFVLAGGARKSRFERLQEDLRKALDTFKVEL
jgi:hypothetical protein